MTKVVFEQQSYGMVTIDPIQLKRKIRTKEAKDILEKYEHCNGSPPTMEKTGEQRPTHFASSYAFYTAECQYLGGDSQSATNTWGSESNNIDHIRSKEKKTHQKLVGPRRTLLEETSRISYNLRRRACTYI